MGSDEHRERIPYKVVQKVSDEVLLGREKLLCETRWRIGAFLTSHACAVQYRLSSPTRSSPLDGLGSLEVHGLMQQGRQWRSTVLRSATPIINDEMA